MDTLEKVSHDIKRLRRSALIDRCLAAAVGVVCVVHTWMAFRYDNVAAAVFAAAFLTIVWLQLRQANALADRAEQLRARTDKLARLRGHDVQN